MTKSQRLLAGFLDPLDGFFFWFSAFWGWFSFHSGSGLFGRFALGRFVVEHHSFDVMDKTFVEGACIVRESMLSVNTPFACAMISALCDSPPGVAKPSSD